MSDAVTLEAREIGGGGTAAPPLLVMHGLLGSSRNWQAHGKALARHRRVFLVDLRNHGASPWSDIMDYPAMAADILALADRHGLKRVALLGHSMGGKAAILAALEAPERIERLIVADIAPVAYGHNFDGYIAAMRAIDLASVDRRATAEAALAPAVPDLGVRQFLLQNLDFDGEGRAFWKPNLEALAAAMAAVTGWPEEACAGRTYQGPALAIRGGNSAYVDARGEAALRRFLPAVEIETLDGAGHWLHAEAPLPFLAVVQRFLNE